MKKKFTIQITFKNKDQFEMARYSFWLYKKDRNRFRKFFKSHNMMPKDFFHQILNQLGA